VIRQRAIVCRVTGETSHLVASRIPEALEVSRLPDPFVVELSEQESGVYLLRLDRNESCISDTWHESIEAAREQAKLEYGVQAGDRIAVE
jgi:hypothetical protein